MTDEKKNFEVHYLDTGEVLVTTYEKSLEIFVEGDRPCTIRPVAEQYKPV